MVLDFTSSPYVTVFQTGMVEEIVSSPGATALHQLVNKPDKRPSIPAAENLFLSTDGLTRLSADITTTVHSLTAKILFIANRSRPDLLTFISYMTKRVLHPTIEDAKRLLRAISYLRITSSQTLRLGYTGTPAIRTFIDASFATQADRKSHTGVAATLGTGVFYTKSTTQKIIGHVNPNSLHCPKASNRAFGHKPSSNNKDSSHLRLLSIRITSPQSSSSSAAGPGPN
jgi:hypothetical protein